MKPRLPRTLIHVPARMRAGTTWSDVIIKNMSRRGLMAETLQVPTPRSYVEIRRGTQIIVGRVIWTSGRRFGVHTQEAVDFNTIVAEPRLLSRPRSNGEGTPDAIERRNNPDRHIDRIASSADRSRQLSTAMQYLAVAAAAAIGAILLATEVYRLLTIPFQAISNQL